MVILCYMDQKFKQEELNDNNHHLLKESLWIDLINPTPKEEELVEDVLKLNIPTRQEMSEIEISNRLYKENGHLFMTATMTAQSESLDPKQDAVTFLLTATQLITVRYIEPQAFKLFASIVPKLQTNSPTKLLTELLDATVDRLADILESISHQLEHLSKDLFLPKRTNTINYKHLLQQLGNSGALNSKIVESLVSFNRLISFFEQSTNEQLDDHERARLLTLSKDIYALDDHANFLSTKIGFLLDATLGMVQIEQNVIIKIFSVAAVIFLPPTLIASIYGMNFKHIPETDWHYGYIYAICLMIFSSWLPFKYFKHRKWL